MITPITIDITAPEGATENDVLVAAVLNALKPAIVRLAAEAARQATDIERASFAAWLDEHAAAAQKEADEQPDAYRLRRCEGQAVAFRGAAMALRARSQSK